jgi:hypothetical protein
MADKEQFFEDAVQPGKPNHRLCLDFNHPDGMREFLFKAKSAGILHHEVEPICIFAEGPASVWLIAKRKKQSVIEMN